MALTVTTTSTGDALTTVAAVKELLGLVGSSEDLVLGRLVDRASEAINMYCGRTFARQSYVETVPAYGGPILQVSQTPIRSILSVTYRGESITDYVIEDPSAGWLYRERGWEWTKSVSWGLVDRIVAGGELPLFSVTYQAGYLLAASASSEGRTLPHDIEQAAIESVKAWFTTRARGDDVESKKIGELSITYRSRQSMLGDTVEALPINARALLRPYLRVA